MKKRCNVLMLFVLVMTVFLLLIISLAKEQNRKQVEKLESTEIETEILNDTILVAEASEIVIEPRKAVMVKEYAPETKEVAKPILEQMEAVAEPEPTFYLTEEERTIVECMVMGEAGGEPYDGKVLVAQCILNACLKDDIQPSEVRRAYKYSGYNTDVSDSVKQAVVDVFDNGEFVTDEPILYFYAWKRGYKSWHESQDFVIEVGGHRFFKEVCANEE